MIFKLYLFILSLFFFFTNFDQEAIHSFDDYPFYEETDLGLLYSNQSSQIKIWAPTASEAIIRIYNTGQGGKSIFEQAMKKDSQGSWIAILKGNWKNKFYTVQLKINNEWLNETVDPYAKAVGVNGKRAAIIDLTESNPSGWQEDQKPELKNFSEIILYELHIRDISISSNSGIKHKGKYLGLTETGTELFQPNIVDSKTEKTPSRIKTGLDHLKELGITHVHLLPCYDFSSIDESKLDSPQYNWGYDPQNYNVPEGSYATDPFNPIIRIKEFKEMVQTLHQNGLRVVMDVVYNHTSATELSSFNQLVPGYYYRQNSDNSFSNASGCGNEIASERPMVRKFIIESISYWATEYHIDGFRFDLMGILDIETMKEIKRELHKIDSTIFIYGEGWTAGNSPYPAEKRALKANMQNLDSIAAFCDDLRDGIKGSWSDHKDKGFVSGKMNMEESVKFGIVGATQHSQINYSLVNYSKSPWAKQAYQCINYTSCHDDLTLWDKLLVSTPQDSINNRIDMYKLANAIILTSQGIPFLHSGVELLRTKYLVSNSYKSPDYINEIEWQRKIAFYSVFEYYKNIIALRKHFPAFRMNGTDAIKQKLSFMNFSEKNVVGYMIHDVNQTLIVIYNANKQPITVQNSDKHDWHVVVDGNEFDFDGTKQISPSQISVKALSMFVAWR